MLLLLFSMAFGAERSCEGEYRAADFEGWVAAADEALSNDDVVGHGRAYSALQDKLPCMVEPVPTEAWAQFLVGLAVIEHALGQEWEEPMTSALLAWPDVPHSYGPDEIQGFAPILVSHTAEALPSDATLYVDGKEQRMVKPLPGVHIVQRQYVGVWEARIVRDGEIPSEWRVDKPLVEEPVATEREPGGTWGTAGLLGGFGSETQLPGATNFPDASAGGAAVGLASAGELVFGAPGLFWDVAVPLHLSDETGLAPDLFAGARIGFGPAALWLGGGAVGVAVHDPDAARRTLLPQPHLGLRLGLPLSDALALDAGLAGGWTPSATHETLALGVRSLGGLGFSAGLDVSAVQAAFVEAGGGTEVVRVNRLRAGLRAGIAFGG